MRCGAYYTVETSLVMSALIIIIFSTVTCTLKLYGKVSEYGEKCAREAAGYGISSDNMRLERLLCGAEDMISKGEE